MISSPRNPLPRTAVPDRSYVHVTCPRSPDRDRDPGDNQREASMGTHFFWGAVSLGRASLGISDMPVLGTLSSYLLIIGQGPGRDAPLNAPQYEERQRRGNAPRGDRGERDGKQGDRVLCLGLARDSDTPRVRSGTPSPARAPTRRGAKAAVGAGPLSVSAAGSVSVTAFLTGTRRLAVAGGKGIGRLRRAGLRCLEPPWLRRSRWAWAGPPPYRRPWLDRTGRARRWS